MALALAIFLVVFITQVISWIGKSVLQETACNLYLHLVRRETMAKQRQLKADILTLKSELMHTSAQEEFAKWAKLRRKVDKGLADLETLNKELVGVKASFGATFQTVLWCFTSGVQFVIGWWYSRRAVFFIPAGVLGPLTWWLAFPWAPSGSVSCMVWQFACQRVIKILERVVRDLVEWRSRTHVAQPVPAEDAVPSAKKDL
ncbi:hypothetical protein EXIGLDRAFT_672603 [Exidia glandulosa HHB12029]|uniref:Uncharacterized protein n=1 Tax=Exidia glandulosa HHB12029 TaxID=1314781 RepID=A0A166ATI9_EXIGL|nr:hypothetical protein EXIGLDRAFT_679050 [Exidia glandulosa HHB12029]KZV95039.1 hypothetical protein EXIGLDRAFT_672603 [Exidia glandulosa HHB12029]